MQETPFAELEVPEEPGVWRCARHHKVHTRLRCGLCLKPICPRCTVMAPTGARCRECASNRSLHMYQVTPRHLLIAFVAAAVLGMVGAVLLNVAGVLAFWVLLYIPALVPAMTRLVARLTGGKRGPKVATVVCLGFALGTLGTAAGPGLLLALLVGGAQNGSAHHYGQHPVDLGGAALGAIAMGGLLNPILWVFLVLSLAGLWYWLK